MRTLAALVLCLFASNSFAQSTGQSVTGLTTVKPTVERTVVAEGSYEFSSLNRGTPYAGVALMHEWDSGYALGVRGLIPLGFDKENLIYMGQIVFRIMILNDIDQMYIEPTLTQGFFSQRNDTSQFAMFGAKFGFNHHFGNQYALGANLGVDYGTHHIANDEITDVGTFYSQIGLTASYYF